MSDCCKVDGRVVWVSKDIRMPKRSDLVVSFKPDPEPTMRYKIVSGYYFRLMVGVTHWALLIDAEVVDGKH